PIAATSSRRAVSSCKERRPSSPSTRICGRPTLDVRSDQAADPIYNGARPLQYGPLPDRIRHRFPIFERRVYINSCSQGALSDSVRAAYDRYLADWDEHGAPWEYWVGQLETARRSIAGLIGAGEDDVAVTTSVSAGPGAV